MHARQVAAPALLVQEHTGHVCGALAGAVGQVPIDVVAADDAVGGISGLDRAKVCLLRLAFVGGCF